MIFLFDDIEKSYHIARELIISLQKKNKEILGPDPHKYGILNELEFSLFIDARSEYLNDKGKMLTHTFL